MKPDSGGVRLAPLAHALIEGTDEGKVKWVSGPDPDMYYVIIKNKSVSISLNNDYNNESEEYVITLFSKATKHQSAIINRRDDEEFELADRLYQTAAASARRPAQSLIDEIAADIKSMPSAAASSRAIR